MDYSRLKDGEAFLVEVTTLFVPEYSKAADQGVPWWWWKEGRCELREREEKIFE